MVRGLLAFLTILFLLISTALLLIGSVSVPATSKLSSKMMLAKVNKDLLGIFGVCSDNGRICSHTSFGYSVDSLVQEFYYKGDKRYVLSKVLITHIIGTGMSFLSACLVFLSFFVVKQALNIFNILFVFLTALVTCCALGVELTLFLPHNTWQSYVVAGAVGSDLLAILSLCFRSVSISRMHTHKKSEETSSDTVDSFSAYREKDNYPLTMDDKLTNVPATLPKFNDALTSASELGPPSDSDQGDFPFKERLSPSVHENNFSSNTPIRTRSGNSLPHDNLLKTSSHDDNPYAKFASPNSNNNFARSQTHEQGHRNYSPHKTGRAPGFPPVNTNKQDNNPLLSSDPFSKSDSSPTSSDDTYSSFFDVNPNLRLAESEPTQGQPSPPVNEHPFSQRVTRPFAPQVNNNPIPVSDTKDTKLPTEAKAKQQTHVPDFPIDKQDSHPGNRNNRKLATSGNVTKSVKNLSREKLTTNPQSEPIQPNAQRSRKPASMNGSFNDLSSIPSASTTGVPRAFEKRSVQKPARNTMERSPNLSQVSLGSAFSGPSMHPHMSKAEMRNPANLAPVSSTLDQLSGNADFELPVRGGRNNRRSDGVSRMIR
ncbi:plasma membrane anchored protein, claudin family, predicted membrane sensor Mac1 [Schizosaccharomyces osmophilus]|uniref:Plasma membrane anchored protein, claudin family, predicted membrane sensor Mac1 n=1 Tax=Schizosaccharomyces osmophilus TaxID=2545709 RepID=A0AAE9WE13_9SCHI|nr:plasma membrane anchored protein, claudin family, predicted membrane sensor Mac1 [Schizosaccharomyces osmophilus]WBW74505.1 plasma membrane anchored protein, claudin family, predicted membrane sensor Mac1 [Schizosaccharomyces osmophilus]